MEVSDRKVSFRYKFKDFLGPTAVPAGWEALLETSCRRLEIRQNISISLATLNFTEYQSSAHYRWINPVHWDQADVSGMSDHDYDDTMAHHLYDTTPRTETIQMCKSASSSTQH